MGLIMIIYTRRQTNEKRIPSSFEVDNMKLFKMSIDNSDVIFVSVIVALLMMVFID